MTTVVDLTHHLFDEMAVYPGIPQPTFRPIARVADDGYAMSEYHLINHIGTHIDSWGHVNPAAPRAEGIPLEYCYGNGVVLDLTFKKPGEEISVADIQQAEQKLGGYQIKPLDIVLLRTDAAKQRMEKEYLTNHPGMTKEAVHYILDIARFCASAVIFHHLVRLKNVRTNLIAPCDVALL